MMTVGTTQMPAQLFIRSDFLKTLRELAETQKWIGSLAQFQVVVDANIIIGDLIWLVCKRKDPEAITELMECALAGTLIVNCTKEVIAEVVEYIPDIAQQHGKQLTAFLKEWRKYKKLLKLRKPPARLIKRYDSGQDPDDAPTLALADWIGAHGILSKDTDIEAMGGFCLELDFTKQARDYSRKIVVSASIKWGLGQSTALAGYASVDLARGMASIARGFSNLPNKIKVVIIATLFLIILHPKSREFLSSTLKNAKDLSTCIAPLVVDTLLLMIDEMERNNVAPPVPIAKIAEIPKSR